MNIIGDQLITNKIVGVIEVVKNCYDADAENVQVRFFNVQNRGKDYLAESERPYIEIEDDGDGMTLDIIKNIWLRPATPHKLDKKNKKENRTEKGRIIQGEKGVGRFAIHKLGEKIEVFTKIENGDEIKLLLDFTEFNPETINLFNQQEYKLLSEVRNEWLVQKPAEEIKKPKGTLIRIFNLREGWEDKDFKQLRMAANKLLPPYDPNSEEFNIKLISDFNIDIYNDGAEIPKEGTVTFQDVIEKAHFKMKGVISEQGVLSFEYESTLTNRKAKREINLLNKESQIKFQYDLYSFKEHLSSIKKPACGEFRFSLYSFDLSATDHFALSKVDKDFVKSNFVYVYRDGVRVYPFGEKEHDWLELSKLRAQISAGKFPSYNDLMGFVYITQEDNAILKDATNRQGMMNIDGAYEDFRYLMLGATEIMHIESKIDKEKKKVSKNKTYSDSNMVVRKSFDTLKNKLEKLNDLDTLKTANDFLDKLETHTDLMKERMETVEDLAGLGMAVEKASHDALMLLAKMRGNIKDFKVKAKNKDYKNEELVKLLNELDENLNFVYDEMQVIQPLFKIQRKAIQEVSIYESIEKVQKYFRRELENKISVQIIKDKDVIVKTNNGLILQVLINLIDNAIYWSNKKESKKTEITFKINTKDNSLIIADNGPGIREDVEPLIFNEFFSLKSDGRGLGLYIVKEILMRINAEISVIQEDKKKLLPGANFLIKFNNEQS
ncbi:MAG: ATP-binding protein [Saprospiraceae bacterium]|nr:ATP-binding protein [Saprospiraceae bacterium]